MKQLVVILLLSAAISILADDPDFLVWNRRTPTGDIPTNITAGVFSNDGVDDLYLLLGQREIWPSNGQVDITFSNAVYKYDIPDNEWKKLVITGAKPQPRAYPAYAGSGTRIFFYGGSTFDNTYGNIVLYSDLWFFNTNTKTFTQLQPVSTGPGPRAGAAMWKVEDQLFLFGGIKAIQGGFLPIYSNDLWQYDLNTNLWTLLDAGTGPSSRAFAQLFTLSGHIYINGGEFFNPQTFGFETPNDTWEWNTYENRWTDVTPKPAKNMLPARNYGAYFRLPRDSEVLWGVYAGELEGNQTTGCGAPFPQNPGNDLWTFDALDHIWKRRHPAGEQPPALKRAMGTTVSNNAWVISGFSFNCPGDGQVYNNNVYKLHFA